MSANKRQFYRLAQIYPVDYRLINKNYGFGEYKKAVRLDLSGGGVKILSAEDINLGAYLQLKIWLQVGNNINVVEICGEVVWRQSKSLANKEVYELGLQYFDYQEKEKQVIIRYIHLAQINQKKNLSGGGLSLDITSQKNLISFS